MSELQQLNRKLLVALMKPATAEIVADRLEELEADNARLKLALTRITEIRWGWDGDCVADKIARDALDP